MSARDESNPSAKRNRTEDPPIMIDNSNFIMDVTTLAPTRAKDTFSLGVSALPAAYHNTQHNTQRSA